MPVIQRVVHIERPIADAFQAITAFDRVPEWIPRIHRAYISSSGATGVGTTFVEEAAVLGHSIRFIGTVIEYDPPRKFAYRYETGLLPGYWQYTFTSAGQGTQLDFRFEIVPPKRFWSTQNPLLHPLIRRLVFRNVDSFKAWVEQNFKPL